MDPGKVSKHGDFSLRPPPFLFFLVPDLPLPETEKDLGAIIH